MLGSSGERVLGEIAAAVVSLAVVPASLHLAVAQAASKEATEQVWARGPSGLADRGAPVRRSPLSGGLEELLADQGLVGDAGGADPGVLVVPAEKGLGARRDVFYVDQDLVAALAAPDRDSGVARVRQDCPDGALAPTLAVPMGVADPIIGGWRGNSVPSQTLGDREQAPAAHILLEDPDDDGRRNRVGFQAVDPYAEGGLPRVGVRAGVRQSVPVRR